MPDQTNEEVKTDAPVETAPMELAATDVTSEQVPPAPPQDNEHVAEGAEQFSSLSGSGTIENGEVKNALVEKGPFAVTVTWIEGAFPSDMEAAGKFIAEGLQEMNDEPDSVPSCIKSILISRI